MLHPIQATFPLSTNRIAESLLFKAQDQAVAIRKTTGRFGNTVDLSTVVVNCAHDDGRFPCVSDRSDSRSFLLPPLCGRMCADERNVATRRTRTRRSISSLGLTDGCACVWLWLRGNEASVEGWTATQRTGHQRLLFYRYRANLGACIPCLLDSDRL